MRNLTVVIKDGRIRALAKLGFIEGGRKVQVVNAGGKYLIPGLWDMDVRSGAGASAWDENIIYPLYVANGVTGVRDMGGDVGLLQQRRDHIESGQLLGPHLLFGGRWLDGGAKSDEQVIAVNTPAEGREAVHTIKDHGADFVHIMSRLSRESYLAIADEAKRLRMRLVGHVPEAVSASEASASGQRSIDDLSAVLLACSSDESDLRQKRLEALAKDDSGAYAAFQQQMLATYNPEKAWKLFSELTDHNTYGVPSLIWWRTGEELEPPEMNTDTRLKYVPARVRAEWDSAKAQHQFTPDQLSNFRKSFSRYLDVVHSMHRAGVPFMTGTEAPDPYVFPGFSLHDELELLVSAGFSNADALAAATFYPALFMVKLDQYGVLEPGHVADIVLLDANPLEDIRNTRKISAVVLGGRYYSRTALDRTLAHVAEAAMKQDVVASTR
ncbi:MAG TPA: amidohydrolase family protein [Terriglobales bacterium]|nr:amidohydrolase family protein [Terriglobales bacterium]